MDLFHLYVAHNIYLGLLLNAAQREKYEKKITSENVAS